MSRTLIVVGLVLVALGLVSSLLPSGVGLGRLPGDIRIERDGATIFIPITSCLVVSLLLSAAMWALSKLQ